MKKIHSDYNSFFSNENEFNSCKKIIDIYNERGFESFKEYIENNDIYRKFYDDILHELMWSDAAADDDTDELFEFITSKKLCIENLCKYVYFELNMFKEDMLWNMEEVKPYTRSVGFVDSVLEYKDTKMLIKVLEYNPETLKAFRSMKKEKIENFIQLVDSFTKKSIDPIDITEEDFKKLLAIISKNVPKDEFQFLLEYLMRDLVYIYSVVGAFDIFELNQSKRTYNNDCNIIELVKYIHNLYGHKFKISFNIIDYNKYHHVWDYDKKNMIYDQMIFNGYEFLSTFASIFYEDLFFPKKDLINHIVDKNNFYRLKIKEDNLNKNDFTFFIKYQRTLSELVSNINTIKKEIESEQLKYLQDLIADIDVIYDELVDKYSERMI
jgi:hypothetical protein